MSVKNRRAEFDIAEGQKRDRPDLSSSQEKSHTTHNSNDLRDRLSKFDAQDSPALLLTYRSSTLSERKLENQHTSDNSLLLSGRELIDKFYSLLGQRVSKSKRKKSLDECLTSYRKDSPLRRLIMRSPGSSHTIQQRVPFLDSLTSLIRH
jgi:hypothetical protein